MLKAGAVTAGALALSGSAQTIASQEDEYEDDPPESVEDIRIPYLDLNTMEAELNGQTLEANSYPSAMGWQTGSTTYVGEVGGRPGLFAGVSLRDDAEQTEESEESEVDSELIVYLCDGEPGTRDGFGLHSFGEYVADGVTHSSEDTEVKLALVDGEFLGAVILADGESFPFIASEATGDAGMYFAWIDSEEETSVRWVVLPDGRQRGAQCVHVPNTRTVEHRCGQLQ